MICVIPLLKLWILDIHILSSPRCLAQNVALDDLTRPLLPHSNHFEWATAPSHNNLLAPLDSAHLNVHHSQCNAAFDLCAATWSLIIIVISFVMTCFAFELKTFTIVTILSSFGTGCAPAIESLALSLMPNGSEDAGKLFGSFAVVKTLTWVMHSCGMHEGSLTLP